MQAQGWNSFKSESLPKFQALLSHRRCDGPKQCIFCTHCGTEPRAQASPTAGSPSPRVHAKHIHAAGCAGPSPKNLVEGVGDEVLLLVAAQAEQLSPQLPAELLRRDPRLLLLQLVKIKHLAREEQGGSAPGPHSETPDLGEELSTIPTP